MQKAYTAEFKREAVRLAQTSGKPITHIARDLEFPIPRFINGGRSWLNTVRGPSQVVGISQLKKKKSVVSSVNWKW